MFPTLANFMTVSLAILFVLVAAFLVLVVLIQKPKGGGLAGAFGGAGGSEQAMFGARAGDFLTWFTVALFVIFLLLGIGLVYATRAESQRTNLGVEAAPTTEEIDMEPNLGPPGPPSSEPTDDSPVGDVGRIGPPPDVDIIDDQDAETPQPE